MSDVLILDMADAIKGNCEITGYIGKIIVQSYSHGVALPMQMDASQTERTAGRPSFTELTFSKMSDLSTTELYKACTRGTNVPLAKLHVGRVENGVYMAFLTYEMTNAMVSNISTAAGGGLPSDSFSINFTKIKCDYTKQKTDSAAAGTATWNWNLETMKAD